MLQLSDGPLVSRNHLVSPRKGSAFHWGKAWSLFQPGCICLSRGLESHSIYLLYSRASWKSTLKLLMPAVAK